MADGAGQKQKRKRTTVFIDDPGLHRRMVREQKRRGDKSLSKTYRDLARSQLDIQDLVGRRKIEIVNDQIVLGRLLDTTA